jgi:hypothetical protein
MDKVRVLKDGSLLMNLFKKIDDKVFLAFDSDNIFADLSLQEYIEVTTARNNVNLLNGFISTRKQ